MALDSEPYSTVQCIKSQNKMFLYLATHHKMRLHKINNDKQVGRWTTGRKAREAGFTVGH